MFPSKQAKEVAEKIKSLPSDKQQEILKSIESLVAESTRETPRKYAGAGWATGVLGSETGEERLNVWRFTAGSRPTNPVE